MTLSPSSFLRTLPICIAIDVLIISTPSRSLLARSFLPFIHVCIAIDTFYVWIHPWPTSGNFVTCFPSNCLPPAEFLLKTLIYMPFTQPKQSGANRQYCQSWILHITSSIAMALFSPRPLGRISNAWEAATLSPLLYLSILSTRPRARFFFFFTRLFKWDPVYWRRM